MTGLSRGALGARVIRSGVAGSALVGLLVGGAALAVALAPRLLATVGTAEIASEVRATGPALADLSGTGLAGLAPGATTLEDLVGRLDADLAALPARLSDPLAAAVGPAAWVIHTSPGDAERADGPRQRLLLDLVLDPKVGERVAVQSGTLPRGAGDATDPAAPLEVAVPAATAAAAALEVGDLLDYSPRPLRVAAIVTPQDPDDPYWERLPTLQAPRIRAEAGVVPTVTGSVWIAPDAAPTLRDTLAAGRLEAWMPVFGERIAYADAAEVARQARQLSTTTLFLADNGSLDIRSSLPNALERAQSRIDAVGALVGLVVSGVLGVLVAVAALGVRTVLARRAATLALLAARGASGAQLRGLMALEGLLVGLPAAALAVGVAPLLVPGPVDPRATLGAAALGLLPAVLVATLASPGARRAGRRDLRIRGGSRRRLLAEIALAGVAALATGLLLRRGLVLAPGGLDPLLTATPLLLALAVSAVTLRLTPGPLRALQRALARRPGAVGVVGAARAIRDPALGFAAALALVVGVSVVIFSVVLTATVQAGLTRGARESVGADVQVRALDLGPAVQEAVAAVPGVAGTVALTRLADAPFRQGTLDRQVTVVVADSAALHAIRADVPALDPAAGTLPILASDDWAARLAGDDATLAGRPVVIAASIPAHALPGVSRQWVLVDAASAAELGLSGAAADVVLAGTAAGADVAEVAADIRDVVVARQEPRARSAVVVRDATSAGRELRTPAVDALEGALTLSGAASLVLAILALALASIGAAPGRARLLGVLDVLGMTRRQIRAVIAWESGPLVVSALVAGPVLGVALAALVTTVVDLRPFVGGLRPPPVAFDAVTLTTALGAVAIAALVAGAVAAAIAHRLAPARALKMGES